MMSDWVAPTISAVAGAIAGGGIGLLASTFAASFGIDRQRRLRSIGIAKALREDVRRMLEGLGDDGVAFLHRIGGVKRVPPSISPWVQPLIADIAYDLPEAVALYMRLDVQLNNLAAMIQQHEPAQARVERAETRKNQALSQSGIFAFKQNGEPVFSTDVEEARWACKVAEDDAKLAVTSVRMVHASCRETLAELQRIIEPVANERPPERIPWPVPPELRGPSDVGN